MYNSFNTWGWLDHCAADVKGQFEVFAGDIRDPHGVKEAMKGCDAVLHLAALIAIPFSYHSPDTYVDTNIKGTLNILLCTSKWAATGVDLLLCHVWVFVKSVGKGILLRLGKVIKKH